jgi:hypothetical protein
MRFSEGSVGEESVGGYGGLQLSGRVFDDSYPPIEAEEEGEDWEVLSVWCEESYSRSSTSDFEDGQGQLSSEEDDLEEELID